MENRYALALYELSQQQHVLELAGRDLETLQKAIRISPPLKGILYHPLMKPIDQAHAINALADKMGACALTKKFLGVLIRNRRLPALEKIIESFFTLHHERQGEVTAEIRSAFMLSDLQGRMLADNLQATLKRRVTLRITEDRSLLGGIVVRIGSRLFDSSIKSKLERLRRTLAETA